MNFGPGGPGGPGFGPGPRRPMEAGGGPGGPVSSPGRLPDNILAILSSKGVEKDGVKGFVLSDMSGDGDLCDCRVILTEDAVIILSVREELKGSHSTIKAMLRERLDPIFATLDEAYAKCGPEIRKLKKAVDKHGLAAWDAVVPPPGAIL